MADWDMLNEVWDDIADWSEGSHSLGKAEQATFDGKECLHIYVTKAGGFTDFYKTTGVGSVPGAYTVEVDVYPSLLAAGSGTDLVHLGVCDGTRSFNVMWYQNGFVYIKNSGGTWSANVGATCPDDEWHRWRFEIHNGGTDCDVYKDNVLIVADMDCDAAVDADNDYDDDGDCTLKIRTTSVKVSLYLDHLKIDTGIGGVGNESGMKLNTSGGVITLGSRPLTDPPKLRYQTSSETLGLCLVDVGDENASPLRVYDGSNIKAIGKVMNV